jgi:cytochrome b6-f complex iron-sulfur subunit
VTAVDPTPESALPTPRREVLCGLVVALLAPGALAAACSNGPSPDNNSGGGNGGGGGGTGGGSGQVLAALSDVPQGGGLLVKNPSGRGQVLLTRPSGDTVIGFNPTCTHQGTTVKTPVNGTITCPNHGSQYDAATGAVKRGPATLPLNKVSVKVQGNNVVMA